MRQIHQHTNTHIITHTTLTQDNILNSLISITMWYSFTDVLFPLIFFTLISPSSIPLQWIVLQTLLHNENGGAEVKHVVLRIRKAISSGASPLATSWSGVYFWHLTSCFLYNQVRRLMSFITASKQLWKLEKKHIWTYSSYHGGHTRDHHLFLTVCAPCCRNNRHFEQWYKETFSHAIKWRMVISNFTFKEATETHIIHHGWSQEEFFIFLLV